MLTEVIITKLLYYYWIIYKLLLKLTFHSVLRGDNMQTEMNEKMFFFA